MLKQQISKSFRSFLNLCTFYELNKAFDKNNIFSADGFFICIAMICPRFKRYSYNSLNKGIHLSFTLKFMYKAFYYSN